ncbi:hypothetical protein ACFQDD_00915 [Halorubrum pallidum]|uniref:Uncharacterized protein n=1 Tax=Halorubrum pallidum TaxID=1526114 RepID=A0ABD5T2J9_9EURY
MDVEDVPREGFREWAKRNEYEIVQDVDDGDNMDLIALGEGGSLEIHLTRYGNVHLTKHIHLGGEAGEIEIGDKQLTVTNERGNEHRISPGRYPDG